MPKHELRLHCLHLMPKHELRLHCLHLAVEAGACPGCAVEAGACPGCAVDVAAEFAAFVMNGDDPYEDEEEGAFTPFMLNDFLKRRMP